MGYSSQWGLGVMGQGERGLWLSLSERKPKREQRDVVLARGGGAWEVSGFFLFRDGALMHVWCWWK